MSLSDVFVLVRYLCNIYQRLFNINKAASQYRTVTNSQVESIVKSTTCTISNKILNEVTLRKFIIIYRRQKVEKKRCFLFLFVVSLTTRCTVECSRVQFLGHHIHETLVNTHYTQESTQKYPCLQFPTTMSNVTFI